MMFPNTPCTITPKTGNDENGKPLLGYRFATLCSVVRLTNAVKKTSIRTDRSASQGNAFEVISDARLLFAPSVKLSLDDLVTINGVVLTVISVQQRIHNITGVLDHYQVELNIYGT